MGGELMFPGRPILPLPAGPPGHEAVARMHSARASTARPLARAAAWRDQGHDRPGCYAHFNPRRTTCCLSPKICR